MSTVCKVNSCNNISFIAGHLPFLEKRVPSVSFLASPIGKPYLDTKMLHLDINERVIGCVCLRTPKNNFGDARRIVLRRNPEWYIPESRFGRVGGGGDGSSYFHL